MAQPRICSLIKMKQPAQNEGFLSASGTGAPAATANTYQTGCIYKRTDGGAETALYVNEGTFASPSWVPLLTTSFEIADLPDVGACTYGAGKILVADGDSYEEVAMSQDATLASDGKVTVVSARAGTVSIPALTGYAAISTAALTLAEVDVLDAVTPGTVAASKAVVADAHKTARWGGFNTAAATTDAVPFASVPNTWSDGQLDVFSVFGGSSTNIGSGSSAKCIRARHVVNAATATVEHETYGVVGQLVVKDATLGHLHAGIMGTFEGHTSGVVVNGGYSVGAACITARLGGHATITATDPIAGFLAFNNGAAALASGISAAFATSSASASYPWVLGCYMPVGSVTQAIRVGDFSTSAATAAAIQFSTAQDLWSDGQLSTVEVFGASASDLTSAYSAKCIRGRHVANVGTGNLAHETYGVMGQLVVKDTTLTHLHAGLIGTLEGHTSGVVVNGSYTYGAAAVMARVDGGAAITATKDIAGFAAFLNGAAMASGDSVAYAIGDQGTAPWTHGIGVERCTNLFDLPAAGTDPVIANALVPAVAPDAGTVGADACLRVLVNNTAYYIPLYDTLHA